MIAYNEVKDYTIKYFLYFYYIKVITKRYKVL